MESITLIGAGWASGVNAYLTVLILGLSGRFGWADTPASIQRPWVLVAAGALFAVEFVVDKIPLLDSAWDTIHTLVRPLVGGMLGTAIAGAEWGRPQAFALAAGLALTGHAAKATSRLAINMSPEPLTNIVASFGEDGVVSGVVALALAYPKIAAVVGALASVVSVVTAFALFRVARRGWRRVRRSLGGQRGAVATDLP
jgi:hypothetical protein